MFIYMCIYNIFRYVNIYNYIYIHFCCILAISLLHGHGEVRQRASAGPCRGHARAHRARAWKRCADMSSR